METKFNTGSQTLKNKKDDQVLLVIENSFALFFNVKSSSLLHLTTETFCVYSEWKSKFFYCYGHLLSSQGVYFHICA